jgi:SAM-dependent methyltransferase
MNQSSMHSTLTPHFWENRYQEGTDRWDLGQAAPPFLQLLESDNTPPPGKTLVLGCGRGYDALLFAQAGHEVIGVDFAPSAIAQARELAKDAKLPVEFLQADIFQLPQTYTHSFDYVVEHTCFCALPPEKRSAYIDLVHSLLKPNGELLAIFFTHQRSGGPPYGIQPSAIRDLFRPQFKILQLDPVQNSVPSRQGEEHFGRLCPNGETG